MTMCRKVHCDVNIYAVEIQRLTKGIGWLHCKKIKSNGVNIYYKENCAKHMLKEITDSDYLFSNNLEHKKQIDIIKLRLKRHKKFII